jgi:hypothetical protein
MSDSLLPLLINFLNGVNLETLENGLPYDIVIMKIRQHAGDI